MELLKKYKHFIIGFGLLFFVFAKVIGIQTWGNIVLFMTLLLSNIEIIMTYVNELGSIKFSIFIGIFLVVCILTAVIIINISNHFVLSKISRIAIMIVSLVIDLLIIFYAFKKLAN